MSVARYAVLSLLSAAGAASAQPIIIPLEKQEPAPAPPPMAYAPPVAPPVASPDMPSSVAEGTPARSDAPPREEAAAPPPK